MDYDADDTIFTGFIYEKTTRELNKKNTSEYGGGTDIHKISLKNWQ